MQASKLAFCKPYEDAYLLNPSVAEHKQTARVASKGLLLTQGEIGFVVGIKRNGIDYKATRRFSTYIPSFLISNP